MEIIDRVIWDIDETATVAIIDSATGEIIKQFQNNAEIVDYSSAIDLAVAKGDGAAMKK
jgi:hypothetical protein